jgi:hypothetical protein
VHGRVGTPAERDEEMISARRAIIAWNSEKPSRLAPEGAVGIGPYFGRGEPDWTEPYDCTGGAAYVFRRELSGVEQDFHVMRDFHMLVCRYGVDPRVVHRAFLEIEEFRAIMSAMGDDAMDPGRETTMPSLRVFEGRGAVHVWPSVSEADIQSTERIPTKHAYLVGS